MFLLFLITDYKTLIYKGYFLLTFAILFKTASPFYVFYSCKNFGDSKIKKAPKLSKTIGTKKK